jgi:zinc D-Ala-D-Ala carboxypeptidase
MKVKSSKHFTENELKCECGCGRAEMDADFMVKLEQIREYWGKPMLLSSAYRCPDHNKNVSSTGENGPHTTGKAVDILCYGNDALELIDLVTDVGINGLGLSQKGSFSSRFIHIDDIETGNRPWAWTY